MKHLLRTKMLEIRLVTFSLPYRKKRKVSQTINQRTIDDGKVVVFETMNAILLRLFLISNKRAFKVIFRKGT